MPEIDSEFEGIGYMVSVVCAGAIDNDEPIFEDYSDATECAEDEVRQILEDADPDLEWEILISEVAVSEDCIEGSQYQTDQGLYASGKGRQRAT